MSYLVDEGGELLNAVTFVVFGAAILGPVFDELGWEVLVYAVLSLTSSGCCRSRSHCSEPVRGRRRWRFSAGSGRAASRPSSSPSS